MDLHFRVHGQAATVFRALEDPRSRRLDLQPIARVNLAKGAIRPHGGTPDAEETARIEAWLAERAAALPVRRAEAVRLLAEEIGAMAHWLQGEAGPEEVRAAAPPLLMAMHDLRGVLLRRQGGDDAAD